MDPGGLASWRRRAAASGAVAAAVKRDEKVLKVWERRGEGMMNHRIGISLVFGVSLIVGAGFARAQEPPPPGPDVMIQPGVPGGDFMAPPMGERIELLGFEGMHGGKVVTGAPFSAVAISETSRTLADGNHISRKTQTNLFRDGQGRFRKEVTLSGFGPLAAAGQSKSFVVISDPVTSENFILHADTKTADKMPAHFGGR